MYVKFSASVNIFFTVANYENRIYCLNNECGTKILWKQDFCYCVFLYIFARYFINDKLRMLRQMRNGQSL